MNLTTKILWALAQHDGIIAHTEAIDNRGLKRTTTIVRYLIIHHEEWYDEARLLKAEITKENLTGDFVTEFLEVLSVTKLLIPMLRRTRKAINEFESGKGKTIDDIFDGVDE